FGSLPDTPSARPALTYSSSASVRLKGTRLRLTNNPMAYSVFWSSVFNSGLAALVAEAPARSNASDHDTTVRMMLPFLRRVLGTVLFIISRHLTGFILARLAFFGFTSARSFATVPSGMIDTVRGWIADAKRLVVL